MKQFEKYHPMMTPHYTLDWLTTFTVKDIYQLRSNQALAVLNRRKKDTAITQTVRYINQTMHKVMSNQALVWGIQARKAQDFLGIFQFRNFNELEKSAEVRFELLPAYQHQGILPELLTHMSLFAFNELKLNRLKAITDQKQTALHKLLIDNGFQLCEHLTVLDPEPSEADAKLAIYERTATTNKAKD